MIIQQWTRRCFSALPSPPITSQHKLLLEMQRRKKYDKVLEIFKKEIAPTMSKETTSPVVMEAVLSSITSMTDRDSNTRNRLTTTIWRNMKERQMECTPRINNIALNGLSFTVVDDNDVRRTKAKAGSGSGVQREIDEAIGLYNQLGEDDIRPNTIHRYLKFLLSCKAHVEPILQLLRNPRWKDARLDNYQVYSLVRHLHASGMPANVTVRTVDSFLRHTCQKNPANFTWMQSLNQFLLAGEIELFDAVLEYTKSFPENLDLNWALAEREFLKATPEAMKNTRKYATKALAVTDGSDDGYKRSKSTLWGLILATHFKDESVPLGERYERISAAFRDMLQDKVNPSWRTYMHMMNFFGYVKKPKYSLLIYNEIGRPLGINFSREELEANGLYVDINDVVGRDAFIVRSCVEGIHNSEVKRSFSQTAALCVIIDVLSFAKKPELFPVLLEKVLKQQIQLNVNFYTSLVEAYGRNGKVEEGLHWFREGVRFCEASGKQVPKKLVGTFINHVNAPAKVKENAKMLYL